jgi:hypothetical protein
MSGAFGWHRNDRSQDRHTRADRGGFSDAVQAYKSPPKADRVGPDTPPPPRRSFHTTAASPVGQAIPTASHTLASTARNVLIVVTDVTGSMGENPAEIFRRLPLMYQEAAKLLGSDDLEILFVAHGDARTDQHAVQVARFGRGPELDQMLTSFYVRCGGGGQGSESPELAAYYLLMQVDTSSAQNVYVWFITDEAGCEQLDPRLVKRWLSLDLDQEYSSAEILFTALRRKMQTFVILMDTGSYRDQPHKYNKIRPYWERMLGGGEAVVILADARRIVDVMLGTVAVMTGQLALFTGALESRQMPTRHGSQNVDTVLKSIALVGRGTSSSPYRLSAKTRPLLPSPDDD